tara:strand:+ start:93 stop:203 length:111 start_codon:yes stop_codon:yes gene_type:complete
MQAEQLAMIRMVVLTTGAVAVSKAPPPPSVPAGLAT